MSRLVITRAQRDRLLYDLRISFGSKLDQTNQTCIVSAASVLKTYLEKNYKCADDSEQAPRLIVSCIGSDFT